MFSLYKELKYDKKPSTIDIDSYVNMIRVGTWQDTVLSVRKHEHGTDEYKAAKLLAPVITGSCVMKPGTKAANNIDHLNGFLVVDIDEEITKEQYYAVRDDKHTHIMHQSIGGTGYAVFVKIDPNKDFKDTFDSVSEYYYNNFNITIDLACSNKNRLRYVSWDTDIYHNTKSSTFRTKKKPKQIKKVDTNYIFTQSDFDLVLEQIKENYIDLCQEDYFRYVRIGMALASEFGSDGEQSFHFICSFGSKYNERSTRRDYNGFVKNTDELCTIGTFYYYCKEAGLQIYSEKTKTIINRVKVSKSQGTPTVDSVVSNLKVANDITANEEDKELIQKLIDSKTDFSKLANDGDTEIEQIENFIRSAYNPTYDVINTNTYINDGMRVNDRQLNNIYINCKKNFDFFVAKSDIYALMESNLVKEVNLVKKFINQNQHNENGYIEEYANCIYPNTEYNLWAFKKWIVGAVHNWTADYNDKIVSPLTLVLSGSKHGTGKTSFLRNIMPDELEKYIIEAKLNANDKDSMFHIASSLMVLDDEFGGKAFKDVKEYKSLSDTNVITQRRPHGRKVEVFKRRAVLCGTTNEVDVLKDVTGNRRILPITVESTNYEKMLTIDKTKLIIEAYNLLKSGFDWMIRTDEDVNYLKQNTESNVAILPIEEIFFKYFSIESSETHRTTCVKNQGEILDFLLGKTKIQVTKYDIKEIFTKNNIQYKSHRVNDRTKKGVMLYMLTDNNTEDEIPF